MCGKGWGGRVGAESELGDWGGEGRRRVVVREWWVQGE